MRKASYSFVLKQHISNLGLMVLNCARSLNSNKDSFKCQMRAQC